MATSKRHRKTLFNTTSTPALLLIEVNFPEITNYQPFPLKKAYLLENQCTFKACSKHGSSFHPVSAVFSKPLFLFLRALFHLSPFCHFGRQDRRLKPQLICTDHRADRVCVLTQKARWTRRATPNKK